VPLYTRFGVSLRLREVVLGAVIAVLVVLVTAWMSKWLEDGEAEPGSPVWRVEAFWLGLAGAALGLIPIILANRSADFGGYSRYTLASAAGGALILVSGIYSLSSSRVRAAIACLFVLAGVMTHHLNSARAVRMTESMRAFWWQAAWRIPDLAPGTTLVANYPDVPIEEDYFVWGPAALIYAPRSTDPERLKPEFSAAVLTQYGLLKILSGGQPDFIDRRSILTKVDYQNILILSRPTTDSCLHALDGRAPVLSSSEENRVMLAAPFSKVDLIRTEATSPVPPELIFGPEPVHDWCYYYEEADLARQRGDWAAVLDLARTAKQQKLAAADAVEWLPFLEAYARAGDVDSVREVARQMKDDYVKFQTCEHLRSVTALSDEVKRLVEQAFCQ
jgi:hypothetical protein